MASQDGRYVHRQTDGEPSVTAVNTRQRKVPTDLATLAASRSRPRDVLDNLHRDTPRIMRTTGAVSHTGPR
ncbi:MAG: hypothetical protein QOJ89_5332 [bacterium]